MTAARLVALGMGLAAVLAWVVAVVPSAPFLDGEATPCQAYEDLRVALDAEGSSGAVLRARSAALGAAVQGGAEGADPERFAGLIQDLLAKPGATVDDLRGVLVPVADQCGEADEA